VYILMAGSDRIAVLTPTKPKDEDPSAYGCAEVFRALLTQNTAPIHFDHHYAAQTTFGKPLVDSTFTLALVTGQSVTDISQNVFANLRWDEVRLPNPVFEGDTIYSQSEVLEKRESKKRYHYLVIFPGRYPSNG